MYRTRATISLAGLHYYAKTSDLLEVNMWIYGIAISDGFRLFRNIVVLTQGSRE